ncbi:mucin-4 [Papilio machaon]|uniref:mucin-4 n=1 Tax=Papilio machaon TaxID=76193 RepID=UPI001E662B52|nr:mucin-4 [Papilio machaon]
MNTFKESLSSIYFNKILLNNNCDRRVFSISVTIQPCDSARRSAQRRRDSRLEVSAPAPSAESLQALAQAVGAAGFEAYTEGKALVKRLIPAQTQPDLDVVEHQGIIGRAGVDFPAFPSIPNTGFNCKNVPTGYYADLETDCQVFHICDTSRKISFLCPNGTIFSQSHLICDWWFKVDCASAPALYESSAEYYSNEQKKTQRVTPTPIKVPDLQHIGESSIRPEPKRAPIVPNTTEKQLRNQKYQAEIPPSGFKASRRFQTLFPEPNPTQKTQGTTPFKNKQKNLVQLIANNFGNVPKRTTVPIFEYSTRRNFIGLNEMQVAAETASFARNQNRQYLQDYNKTYRPYPVYTPNLTSAPEKTKANSSLTTLYNLRDKYLPETTQKPTTKPVTSAPYSKSYTEINYNQEPYTRPGISSLKDFLEKEKNKTLAKTTTTEKFVEVSSTTNKPNIISEDKKVTIETKSSFESVTKIPDVTREDDDSIESSSSDRVNSYTTNFVPETTEPSYQERRERLISKLNFEAFGPTEPTFKATLTEKYYGNLPNRPGLIVPPSLTPKTLHSLAIYYATGLDNLATTATPEDEENTTTTFDEYDTVEDGLPALFSQHTVNKYSSLFGHGNNNVDLRENMKLDPNSTYNELVDDLSTQMSQNPLAASPQIRELAQVFTHALSAYLQDPVQFRKVLSDIRPTPPNFRDMLTTDELLYNTEPTTTINEDDQEILGFSDEHKENAPSVSLRQGKAIKTSAELTTINYPTTTPTPTTTDIVTTPSTTTTIRTPFKCCGRISASYTTAAPSKEPFTTSSPFTNTAAVQINTLSNKLEENIVSTTESNDKIRVFGGFQNNQYQDNGKNTESFDDYAEITKLPSAWGIDATLAPATKGNIFESKRIKYTSIFAETTPVYFTETESFELDNEEELQRAHSQSFITPQGNNVRQGKQINYDETKGNVKKPSENLEAPTPSSIETTTFLTTTDPTTTLKEQPESLPTISSISNIFTSPDSDKTTYQLPTTYENWQSTIMLDPITLNDGLSVTGGDRNDSDHEQQTSSWSLTTVTTQEPEYTETTEPSTVASGLATLSGRTQERYGRLLKDSTTNTPQEITTDTVIEQAKEIMGGMNATTTEKLMNVMMKTKSKTVKRLILLLIQTCDDDHNSTAEASKRALLEALMAVSQKDMEEVAKEQAATESPSTTPEYDYVKTTVFRRRMDSYPENIESDRRGKSLRFDASDINSLSHSTTIESFKTGETEIPTTPIPTTVGVRKSIKKTATKTISENVNYPSVNWPSAQARVASQPVNLKGTSDTRALELLRSLYTIAARWG